jgi:hypothetical protein
MWYFARLFSLLSRAIFDQPFDYFTFIYLGAPTGLLSIALTASVHHAVSTFRVHRMPSQVHMRRINRTACLPILQLLFLLFHLLFRLSIPFKQHMERLSDIRDPSRFANTILRVSLPPFDSTCSKGVIFWTFSAFGLIYGRPWHKS